MFHRWYSIGEPEISEMYIDEVIDFCNAVMMFEGLENSRGAIPMTDQSGMMSFNTKKQKQMDSIWELMFPPSVRKLQEKEEKIAAFKKRIPAYKALAKKIDTERSRK